MKFPWRRDNDIAEEVRAHLRMAEQDRIDRGEAASEASRNARVEFGNELLVRETTLDVWGWAPIERFARDIRYALRQMRRNAGFTIIAVLMLALGLGATTAMFSIVNGVLLEPLKFPDPGRLFVARYVAPPDKNFKGDWPVNARHFYEWRSRCQTCEQVAMMHPRDLTLTGAGEPQKLLGLEVSFNFFRTLGVQPAVGRDFLAEEEVAHPVVILSNTLWRNVFNSDPGVIGRSIRLNGESYTMIGVMPADLHLPRGDQWGTYSGPSVDPLIFLTLLMDPARAEPVGSFNYTAPIRIKPEVPPSAAANELTTISSQFFSTYPFSMTVSLIPLRDKMTVGARSALWLLFGCVGAVMLIVCFNLGNLMLVRATGRTREAGVRMALGASRGHLFRLALIEASLLMLLGGVAGLILAQFALKAFAAAAPIDLPRMDEVGIDWRVLGFAACSALFSTLLCGLIPAWRISRIDPQESLKTGSPNSTGTRGIFRLREILVSVEVAMSTILLIAGGLLSFSFWRVMRADRGFETVHVITQDISFLDPKYAAGGRNRFVPEILDRLREIPGVREAGITNQLPLRGEDWTSVLADPDQATANIAAARLANFRFVTPEYWTAMGIPLKQGRFFRESERDSKVAVISERAAEYLWPGKNPLGRHVRGSGLVSSSFEVVGVVGEIWTKPVEEDPPMIVYEPYNLVSPVGVSIVLRTQSDPAAVISAMRTILRAADPDMALGQTKTMEQNVEESVATRKFETSLVAAFAIAALAIASLGVYGVIAFSVARRRTELGIRMALGAGQARLMTMVLGQGIAPVIFGLAVGIAGALLLGRYIASQLYSVDAKDTRTILAVAATLLLTGICACLVPARRAAKVDPARALKCD